MTTSNEAPKMGSKRSFDVAFLANSSKNESRKEKSAFTKYENQEAGAASVNQEEAPPTSGNFRGVARNQMATPTANFLQFPALRKLLDITGMCLISKNVSWLQLHFMIYISLQHQ